RAEVSGLRQAAGKAEPALREQLLVSALALMERAAARLGDVDDPALRAAVEADLGALRRQRREQYLLRRPELPPLSGAQVTAARVKVRFDVGQIAGGCRDAFKWYLQVDPLTLSPEQAAARLGGGDSGAELAAALDEWATRASAKEEAAWARAVASLLD